MYPATTEVKLENELDFLKKNKEDVHLKIRELQVEMEKCQTSYLELQLNISNKTEELRVFRKMYPSICKPPVSKTYR
jgi:predicted  nucleic acid-binding Zn-ribbon protein